MKKVLFKIKKVLYSIFNKPFFKSIGKGSLINKPMLISGKKYFVFGKNVFFRDGARIECIDNWLDASFKPNLTIGDNTSFEQFAHITSAGNIIIGKNCTFIARTMITNISHEYASIEEDVLKQPITVKDVKIGDNCFIGMDVKIFPGVTIGNNVIVGANSIVMHDIPDYSVAVGVPAKVIKKYNFETKKWEKVSK